ncbi:MAG: GxxExxY protein [Gemmatimonadales bacterium]|nr:GxxExxY protein [Gemmatimonadales bacterium]
MTWNRGTEATEDTEAADRGLTHEIIGSAIEVHRVLGPGLLESVYEAALWQELVIRGFPVQRQVPVPVAYKGLRLNAGIRLDLRVAHRVIVEVKSVERLHSVHRAQLLTYLKLTGLRIGLLFNFNVEFLRHGMRRVLNG